MDLRVATRSSRSGARAWGGIFLLVTALAPGCSRDRWEASAAYRAPDEDVAAALGDSAHENEAETVGAADIPSIRYPRALRPCCVFGQDVKVEVGRLPVPGVEIHNILGLADIGPHRYDNGYLSIEADDPRGFIDSENNGLFYTCRGGFVDTAHVRDNADNTLALTFAIARGMDAGAVIEVPPQGAAMRVRLRALPPESIERYGRMRLAVALAKWSAYQLSVWHEIATWYSYASLAEWPEKISAFSPEDLFSNQLGARLAGAIVLGHGARSDVAYGENMDAWIQQMLKRLEVVSLADARTAARALDGAWWDSERRIPDWKLVERRRMDTGPLLAPWTLAVASAGRNGPIEGIAACRNAGPPLVLRVDDGWNGLTFSDYATVEFDVSDGLAAAGFPFPREKSRSVTQADFPGVIDAVRRANVSVFGDTADRP